MRLRMDAALLLSLAALIVGAPSAGASDHGFKVLYSFGDNGDGGFPLAGVIHHGLNFGSFRGAANSWRARAGLGTL
jgi:hypothetical protein